MEIEKSDNLQNLLKTSFFNQDLCLKDIKSVLEFVCKSYHLDMVFVVTNIEYQFRLKNLIACNESGIVKKKNENLILTDIEYHNMIKEYRKCQISEAQIPLFDRQMAGSTLHCAISRNGRYYGSIGFHSNDERIWKDEEKESIQSISQLMLLYLSFQCFSDTMNHKITDDQILKDPLTGAFNRLEYENYIRAIKHNGETICYIMVDIDNFKIINDTCGHDYGDIVLCQVVKQLKNVFRSDDKVFRLGGDEFAIILYGCEKDIGNSIYRKFSIVHENLKKIVRRQIHITLSAGFCISDQGYYDELSILADEAMYHTKRNGRAGLTQIDSNHKIMNVWNSKILSMDDPNREILQVLLSSEQRLSDCVRGLISITDYKECINYLLRQLIEYYDCDRACLSYLTNEKCSMIIAEQCNHGIANKFKKGDSLAIEKFVKWEKVSGPISIKKMYYDSKDEDSQKWMRSFGLDNMMILSFEFNETELGYLSIDNLKRHKEDSSWITTLAFFVSHELQKSIQQDQLHHLSYYDVMTSCKNRNAYIRMMNNHQRIKEQSAGMIIVAINGLKTVNLMMGEQYGDQMIRKTVEIVTQRYDIENVYRISGAQFSIVEFGQNYEDFVRKAEELREDLEVKENALATIGFFWNEHGMDLAEIEREAEEIVKAEKQKEYLKYDTEPQNLPAYVHHVAEELVQSEFDIYLQSKCYAQTKEICGAEALVRLIDKNGNPVVPIEFIHILEQEKLIANVDYFVLEKVCELLARWKREGKEDYQISCNFSKVTISEEQFVDNVLEILERTKVDSTQLIFEITEASNDVPEKKMTDIMLKLKEKGITFAIDDMGTEYSSLLMLRLPTISSVKFDRSLIQQLEKNEKEQHIVQELIRMFHGLQLECVAEGVENENQLEMLKKMECDKIQGYLIGKPISVQEFEKTYF